MTALGSSHAGLPALRILARRHVIRQSPDPIVATKTPDPSRTKRPRSSIHR
jgi:hypothetical protein